MFAKTLIVLAVATAALGNPAAYGPLLFPAVGRIVGGEAAAAGEIPFQVSIQSNGNSQYCGGSIINSEWILTAAHCSQINPGSYKIRAGTLKYSSGGTTHTISSIVVHPGYNSNTQANDIAVWKISPAFVWDAQTAAGNLPAQGTDTPAGTTVWVSGWGTTSSGGAISQDLLKVDVTIVAKDVCNQQYANYGGIPADQICAGVPEGGKDSCQGDSGGPLYLAETNTLHGVVSWGVGCARPAFPGVYTEVASYHDWILANAV